MKKKVIFFLAALCLVAGGYAAGYYMAPDNGAGIAGTVPQATVTHTQAPAATEKTASQPKQTEKAEKNTKNPSSQAPEQTPKAGKYIGASSKRAKQEGWSDVGTYKFDLTGDGKEDTVTLAVSAQTKNGEILWDDSQEWALEVQDSEGHYYTLLDQRIGIGNVYYEVSELYRDQKTVPAVTVFVTTGSGFDIRQYIYTGSGFEENVIYASQQMEKDGVNTMYSSIPYYN